MAALKTARNTRNALGWRVKNPEAWKAIQLKWNLENPERRRELDRQRQKRDGFKRRQQRIAQYWKDPEKRRKATRISHAKPEMKEWKRNYQKRPDQQLKNKIRTAQWKRDNPSKVASQCARRRAQKALNGVELAGVDLIYKDAQKSRSVFCFYCNHSLLGQIFHMDHITPISKGGKHSCANIAPACTRCNLEKGNKTIQEWNRVAQCNFDI